jgi:hypothetical protein
MWFNCLRHLDAEGTSIGELANRARMRANVDGMCRWGYVTIESRTKKVTDAAILRPKEAGRAWAAFWPTLFPEIDTRWADRLGADVMARLKSALAVAEAQTDPSLPDYLPILGWGWSSRPDQAYSAPEQSSELLFVSLLARPLLALAIEFENEAGVSLAIAANLLRVLEGGQVALRDLPTQAGISKEGVAMALTYMKSRSLATVEPDEKGAKSARLTDQGEELALLSRNAMKRIEAGWRDRMGEPAFEDLAGLLQDIAPSLKEAVRPPAGTWRAATRPPATLPHFPTVLHRGGYPDGA